MHATHPGTGEAEVARFGDSWQDALRITTIRVVVQTVTFAASASFVLLTTFANIDRFPGLRRWVGKFLEIDPLVAIATAITTHTLYKGLLWSLVILIPTLLLGRFFCNWICPYGTLHQFAGWLFRKMKRRDTIEANRYRRMQHVKYFVVTAMLVMAAFGALQIGLLDPISLFHRSLTDAMLPAANMPTQHVFGDYRLHQGAWLIGGVFFALVAMNLVIPRFFCRVLCPLGALLGALSRFAWWRIEPDPVKCTDCDLCLVHCEGACDPHRSLRKSECFVCFNCIEDCPEGALSFKLLPSTEREVTGTDVPRRRLIFAGIAGMLSFPFVRTSGRSTRGFSTKVIRPPGAVEELAFLARCIKCDQCIRVCPTNVLQPAWFEAGLEGFWTPVLNFRMGHCQMHCTACGVVCPTGAIQRISVEEKLGLARFADEGPVKLGTAHFDRGRCLPYSQNLPCAVCEEVCPTSPKAIYAERELRPIRHGKKMAISSTEDTVTVSEWPPSGPQADRMPADRPQTDRTQTGRLVGDSVLFRTDQWVGDGTTAFHLTVRHDDGMTETHQVRANDADTLKIIGHFARPPARGEAVVLRIELKVPRVDATLCIGCGICERQCPVVGDRKAVYVTADGETRSRGYTDPDRNRSVRLID